jgi:DNA-binding transcriptional ArsR family regulator
MALREAAIQGVWGKLLPGEIELSRRLGISRPTLRAALARLAEEGMISIRKGCRTRLLRVTSSQSSAARPTVCLVVPTPRDPNSLSGNPVLMEMRAKFAVEGIGWEEVFDLGLGGSNPGTRLAGIVKGRHRMCWLLAGASAAIQQWFQEARVPTLVLGSCHEGVTLPSVDVNYHAIGWHAAGCLMAKGHKRIAVVLPERPLAGDIACVNALKRYAANQAQPMFVFEVALNSGSQEPNSKLNRLIAGPRPPTAAFCIHVPQVLAVFVSLLRAGHRVPQDTSLMCRETHITLDQGLPELTRYRSPVVRQAHQAVRIARGLLAGNQIKAAPHLIIPAFIPGKTLAVAKA